MEERDYQFPIGSMVQLKHEFGDVYIKAWGGSLGWVRDRKFDEFGFEKVLVEWDKEDWRYNSVSPGWSFANHFILKELPKRTRASAKKELPAVIPDPEMDAYMAELQKGMEAIASSEGFAIFIAKRIPVPDSTDQTMIVPEVYAASHSGEADAVLGIAMNEQLSETFQELTMMILELYDAESNPDL